jgi:hypothetical protein
MRGVEAVVDLDEPAVVEQIIDAELEADVVAYPIVRPFETRNPT